MLLSTFQAWDVEVYRMPKATREAYHETNRVSNI